METEVEEEVRLGDALKVNVAEFTDRTDVCYARESQDTSKVVLT